MSTNSVFLSQRLGAGSALMMELVCVFPSLETDVFVVLTGFLKSTRARPAPPAGVILVTLAAGNVAESSSNRKPSSNGSVGGRHRDLRVWGVILGVYSGRQPCGFPIPAL